MCGGILLVTMSLVFTSCIRQEYNLEDLSSEMTIASSGLAFPLGSTAELTFKDLLDENTAKHIHVDYASKNSPLYGSLFLEEGHGNLSMNDRISDINGLASDAILFGDFKHTFNNVFDLTQIVPPSTIGEEEYVIKESISAEIDTKNLTLEIIMDLPDCVKSISEVTLASGAKMNVKVEFKDPFITKGTIVPDMDLDISSVLQIEGSDNPINLKDLTLSEANNFTSSKDYSITDMNLSFDDLKTIEKKITIGGTATLMGNSTTTKSVFEGGQNSSLVVTVTFDDFDIKSVKGVVDYVFEPVQLMVDISNAFPEGLTQEGMNLDFENPYLVFSIISNLGVPLNGHLSIVPIKDGVELMDIALDLDLNVSASPKYSSGLATEFYIGKSSSYYYDYDGRYFIEGDIASIIKASPDYLQITLSGGSDATKESLVEVGANYYLGSSYHLRLPLSFGEDFRMELSDIIDVSGADIGNILTHTDIVIGGEVKNGFPLNFDIIIELQDANGKVLSTEPISQSVKACSGSEVAVTDLNINLKPKSGTDLSNLAKMNVKFVVTSKGAEGVLITEKSSIQAVLNLTLPSGITFDIE